MSVGLAHYVPYSKKSHSFTNFFVAANHDFISVPSKSETPIHHTYSNNFGGTHLGIGPKGVDGFIFSIIFKPLVSRLSKMQGYLLALENMHLYGESRAFLTYIKEHHGGIFRQALFSSLIDPEKKLRILKQSLKETSTQHNESKMRVSSIEFL